MTSNGIISAPVTITDIKNTIGLNSTGLWDLVTRARTGGVNSRAFNTGDGYLIKDARPFWNIYSNESPGEWAPQKEAEGPLTFRMKMDSNGKLRASMGDFRGYNHNALGPKANPERLSWTDTPAGTDVRLGETDRTAVFNMEITFPEIPTWLFRSAEGQGNVQISYGMPGTPDFKEIVVQPIQIESLCNGNVDTYLEKYANKKIKFQAVQTLNLPARGYSETYYYYLTISNGFMESIEAYKIPVTIHRIKVPDPNNPDDYDYRIPVEYLNPANNTNVTYLRIGVFRKDTYEYFRFENIRNLMTGFELVLNYKTAKKPFANRIAHLTLENEWKNASGIMMYTVPSNNEGKWTVVFRRSIIEGDTATGIIINGERSIG